ncbi:MAG TPA: M50 family metallopeptidase [Chloroflexaceae bacterium]|nr:M50 family metallopeptidase [Chloroflexaceae bacterium]
MQHPPEPGPAATGGALAPAALALPAALVAFAAGWLGPLAYPLRLLTTLVHELAHGLAALLTGGAFLRFVVFADGSGLAYTAGGLRLLIIPAGYVGVALVGAALIAVGRNARASRLALGGLGAALALLTLRYALPTLISAQALGGLLTLLAGVGLGALLLLAAWRAGAAWATFLLNLLGFHLGLSAFGDLWTLFGVTTAAGPAPRSDAAAMAELTFIPAPVWAVVWAALAASALGWAVWWAWLRPWRGRGPTGGPPRGPR